MIVLKYVGSKRYIMGIPARDLTQDDLDTIAIRINQYPIADYLVASGLYERDGFICKHCGKRFKTVNGLNQHELAHQQETTQSSETTETEEE